MINLKKFTSHKVFKINFSGHDLIVETGKLALSANGSCLIRFGESVVLVTATMSQTPRENINFLPLSVDFEERLYAVGRIPGSFIRREGKPSDQSIIAARKIDRALRPLFNQNIRNDIAITCLVLNNDKNHCPIIASMIGASIALLISDIPFNEPIVSMNIGMINNDFVINPIYEKNISANLDCTVAFTKEKIIMIEAFANEISEENFLNAISFARKESHKILNFMNDIKNEIGKQKKDIYLYSINDKIYHEVLNFYKNIKEKNKLYNLNDIKSYFLNLKEKFLNEIKNLEYKNEFLLDINESFNLIEKKFFREMLWSEIRIDDRKMDEIRPLNAEVNYLPQVHGSALFTRGETQVLSTVTLGTSYDKQEIDNIFDINKKNYIHHYNFPSFSVGEAKRTRAPGRREIGHGILAEKALLPSIPNETEFPYVIRVVSEILSSNGSTSQAAICGSTLALMDAGVPLKTIIAGISCGLITNNNKFKTFIDIQGLEDFFGDMDFKIAGSLNGITSIQLDIKTDGITEDVVKEALEKCKIARYEIINNLILKTINKPRKQVSKFAPKIISFLINKDFIRDIIGRGGKIIQRITSDTTTKIDINDDGLIIVSSNNLESCYQAKQIIENIIEKPKTNKIYENSKVVKITLFGAFVEFAYGKEGFLHISKISDKHINNVKDVLKVGDIINVKIINIDDNGKINLSMKDLLGEK